MKPLILITARSGSKGIPGKNMKVLGGKPLIQHTIEAARELFEDTQICVSTDDQQIIELCHQIGLNVPFVRPEHLATDTSSSYDVILHALKYYEDIGQDFNTLILLQPTSPFRNSKHILEALELYDDKLDMVVSVKESHSNPYFNLFEEQVDGYLKKSKESNFSRRQDCPKVYELNGAIYIINIKSVKIKNISSFQKVKKYIMSEVDSVDIDTPLDWIVAETVQSTFQDKK